MALAAPLPLVLLLISLVAAAPTNVTIDDADLAYFTWSASTSSTSAPWAAIAPGAPCNFCSAQPPTTDIQNQTWHDGTNLSSGSFVFQGSDVYIYGIDLANPANISFALDGKPREAHHYAGPDRFVFRALFFAAHDLVPGVNHTVEWAVHATKTNGSTALFDYVVFTADVPATSSTTSSTPDSTPPSTPSKKKSTSGGVIAGAVIAVIAGLGILAALAFFLLSRRRRRNPAHIEPLVVAPIDTSASPTSAAPESSWASTTSPATTHHPDAKTYDTAWNNPTQHTPYTSTESVVSPAQSHAPPLPLLPQRAGQVQLSPQLQGQSQLSPASAGQSQSPPSAQGPQMSSLDDTASTTTTNAALEARLADLEARVGAHLPPPYEGRGGA